MVYPPYPYEHYRDYSHASWSPPASMQSTLSEILSVQNEMKSLITKLSLRVTQIEDTLQSQSSNSSTDTESKRVSPSLSVSSYIV